MIREALPREGAILTALSFDSKRYWGYPEEFFALWEPELTIREEYIRKNRVYLLEDKGRITGYYSLVSLDEDGALSDQILLERGYWLDHMFVRPDGIGKGFGRRLFAHMVSLGGNLGIEKIHILSDPHAEEFYRKMGCTYVREIPSTIAGRTTPYLTLELRSPAGKTTPGILSSGS